MASQKRCKRCVVVGRGAWSVRELSATVRNRCREWLSEKCGVAWKRCRDSGVR